MHPTLTLVFRCMLYLPFIRPYCKYHKGGYPGVRAHMHFTFCFSYPCTDKMNIYSRALSCTRAQLSQLRLLLTPSGHRFEPTRLEMGLCRGNMPPPDKQQQQFHPIQKTDASFISVPKLPDLSRQPPELQAFREQCVAGKHCQSALCLCCYCLCAAQPLHVCCASSSWRPSHNTLCGVQVFAKLWPWSLPWSISCGGSAADDSKQRRT